MSASPSKTWLVTGANSGLGLAITLAALGAGHNVIATARDVERARQEAPQVEKLGGKWLKLDVTDEQTQVVVERAIQELGGGKLDVVVNNAGYTVVGAIEDATIETISHMFSTHVLGPIRVLKGALPTLRAQQSGTVVNMSSVLGVAAIPASGIYSLCKFAIEGVSESLAGELAPFGIRVVLLEPGLFRSNLMQRDVVHAVQHSKHYEETVTGKSIGFTRMLKDKTTAEQFVSGDAEKLGQRVVEVVDGTGYGEGLKKVFRVAMGDDAVVAIEAKAKNVLEELEKTRALAGSMKIEGHGGLGMQNV